MPSFPRRRGSRNIAFHAAVGGAEKTGDRVLTEDEKKRQETPGGISGGMDDAGDAGGGFGTEADESPDEGSEGSGGGPAPFFCTSGEAAGSGEAEAARPAAQVKANTLNRVIARFIDILFALLLAKLPGYVGFLAGLTYLGIADGLWGGRSIGKRIIGLRVLRAGGGAPCDFHDSIIRNSTIGVYYALFHIPILGWILAALGLGFEWLLVVGNAEGMRLGDEVAGTVVADEEKQGLGARG